RPAERDAELELHGAHGRGHRGEGRDERALVARVPPREELEQVLARPGGVAGADGRRDPAAGARPHQRPHRRCGEAGRHRRVGPDRERVRAGRAPETEVDDGLDQVPVVHREERGATVARERGPEHVGQLLEEPRRAVVRRAHAVQVDVVSIRGRVHERARTCRRGELGGESGGVEVVHLERRRAPRAARRVPAPAVRRDEDERRRAGRPQERRRRRHGGLLAFDAATVYTRRMRPLLLVVAALLLVANAGAERPHVYLVVVDGLDARFAAPERMPRLFDLVTREAERTSVFAAAHAVMPTSTNPNHVSLLTGVYPSTHGITGNAYWRRVADAPPEKTEDARLIDVETLFTVAEATAPELVT